MLRILSYGSNGEYGSTIEWTVGEPLKRYSEPMMVRFVDEVRADGDEMEYILRRFSNIPNASHMVYGQGDTHWMAVESMKFYGDDAKFIVGNLIWEQKW